jgi:hypothetical protein
MEKRTTRILLIVSGVIALGGISYYIYIEKQKKKYTKILENSVDKIINQYDVFKLEKK